MKKNNSIITFLSLAFSIILIWCGVLSKNKDIGISFLLLGCISSTIYGICSGYRYGLIKGYKTRLEEIMKFIEAHKEKKE